MAGKSKAPISKSVHRRQLEKEPDVGVSGDSKKLRHKPYLKKAEKSKETPSASVTRRQLRKELDNGVSGDSKQHRPNPYLKKAEKSVSVRPPPLEKDSDINDSKKSEEENPQSENELHIDVKKLEKSKAIISVSVQRRQLKKEPVIGVSGNSKKHRHKSYLKKAEKSKAITSVLNINDSKNGEEESPQSENVLDIDVKKPTEEPKRPLSAYMLWLTSVREEIKQNSPASNYIQIARKTGRMWKAMKDKSEWEAKELKGKKIYEEACLRYAAESGVHPDSLKKSKTKSKRVKNKVSKR